MVNFNTRKYIITML